MSGDFTFERKSRNWPTLITVVCIWIALLLGWTLLDAAWWLVGLIAVFTLPAVYDLWANPVATLRLTDHTLRWSLPRSEAEIALHEIDHVRLDTRLDFSVKATIVLSTGRKLRLPFPATPPHQAFEDALNARNVATRRHHFSLMQ